MCGLVFFALNGYVAGSILAALTGKSIVYFLLFAPVEVSAFVLAFTTACNVSLAFVRSLRHEETYAPGLASVNQRDYCSADLAGGSSIS